MTWHFEILAVNGRRFKEGESYDARDHFASILTIQFHNQKKAYISGLLNDQIRGDISRRDLVELRDALRQQFGVELMEWEHAHELRDRNTGPAPLI